MAEAVDYKQIGSRPVRPDGLDKVTGRAQFGADTVLPNMVVEIPIKIAIPTKAPIIPIMLFSTNVITETQILNFKKDVGHLPTSLKKLDLLRLLNWKLEDLQNCL